MFLITQYIFIEWIETTITIYKQRSNINPRLKLYILKFKILLSLLTSNQPQLTVTTCTNTHAHSSLKFLGNLISDLRVYKYYIQGHEFRLTNITIICTCSFNRFSNNTTLYSMVCLYIVV